MQSDRVCQEGAPPIRHRGAARNSGSTTGTRCDRSVRCGPRVADAFTATTANMTPAGVSLRMQILEWQEADARAEVVATLAAGADAATPLGKLPTVGYVWPDRSPVGYSVKYAHRAAQPDGGERITLVTDKPLGSYDFKGWSVAEPGREERRALLRHRARPERLGDGPAATCRSSGKSRSTRKPAVGDAAALPRAGLADEREARSRGALARRQMPLTRECRARLSRTVIASRAARVGYSCGGFDLSVHDRVPSRTASCPEQPSGFRTPRPRSALRERQSRRKLSRLRSVSAHRAAAQAVACHARRSPTLREMVVSHVPSPRRCQTVPKSVAGAERISIPTARWR